LRKLGELREIYQSDTDPSECKIALENMLRIYQNDPARIKRIEEFAKDLEGSPYGQARKVIGLIEKELEKGEQYFDYIVLTKLQTRAEELLYQIDGSLNGKLAGVITEASALLKPILAEINNNDPGTTLMGEIGIDDIEAELVPSVKASPAGTPETLADFQIKKEDYGSFAKRYEEFARELSENPREREKILGRFLFFIAKLYKRNVDPGNYIFKEKFETDERLSYDREQEFDEETKEMLDPRTKRQFEGALYITGLPEKIRNRAFKL
ncbi:unnamed protein product, partial [marine sediment metagenome]